MTDRMARDSDLQNQDLQPVDTSRAYSVAQLAKRWRCSPTQVYSLIRRGDLKAFRIGTLYRVTGVEVARVDNQYSTLSADRRATQDGGVPTDVVATDGGSQAERFYTLDEAATALRVSSKTLSQELNSLWRHRSGDPLHARFGRNIIVSQSDLPRIYEALKERPTPEPKPMVVVRPTCG